MQFKDYKESIQVHFKLVATVVDEFGNEQIAGNLQGYSFNSIAEQEHKLDYAINKTITAMFEELPENTEV